MPDLSYFYTEGKHFKKALHFRINGVLERERKVEDNSNKVTEQKTDQDSRNRVSPKAMRSN